MTASKQETHSDLSVTFLGTAASAPTAQRSTTAILVSRAGDRLLFDCGEGAQRQMQRAGGLVMVDAIFLSHYHADHYLGLPGLLSSYALADRHQTLEIYGPVGLEKLFSHLSPLIGKTPYKISLHQLQPGDQVAYSGYAVSAFATEHNARSLGYVLAEDERPGRFHPDKAKDLGVRSGKEFGMLQRGEAVPGKDGIVQPEQVMDAPRRGRKLVISGDTAPCKATVAAGKDADLLIHEASFSDEDKARAGKSKHSTVSQAAMIGRQADAEMLALVHIAGRYHVGKLLGQARKLHKNVVAPRDLDVIEIPFPEKGRPHLVSPH